MARSSWASRSGSASTSIATIPPPLTVRARTANGSVRRVAADQRVPERFLSDMMRDLVRAGLVDGTIGRSGGYRLAKPSMEISLLDVVEAVEGDSRRRVCILRGGPCALDRVCDVHAVFAAAQDDALGRLRATTIATAIRPGRRG